MTGESKIDYGALALDAIRGIVRTVLAQVAKTGLPGAHHFYIAFNTGAPGVILSKRLKEKYPSEMTIVLQHRFRDLIVTDDRFEVVLSFDSIPERLSIPFSAIKGFFDPSVPYVLHLEPGESGEEPGSQLAVARLPEADMPSAASDNRPRTPAATPIASRTEKDKKPRASRKLRIEKAAERTTETTEPAEPAITPTTGKPRVVASPPAEGELPEELPPKVIDLSKFRKK